MASTNRWLRLFFFLEHGGQREETDINLVDKEQKVVFGLLEWNLILSFGSLKENDSTHLTNEIFIHYFKWLSHSTL